MRRRAEFVDLIKVRAAVREVLRTQLADLGDEEIVDATAAAQFRLRPFVARFGPINQSANRRAFRGDPDLPLLCSLEDYNSDTNRATKTAIFHERNHSKSAAPARGTVAARRAGIFAQ